ncbi:MAG TPA: TIGR03435 family protein [Acidobacteriaceae bacterium]|nr:TIGR03435 family protein [Acidobacteriaceae bacterium]
MAFEVASVRRDPSGRFIPPPFSMDSDDNYIPTGGLFTTDTSLQTYISFAYKLDLLDPGLSHLPEWVITEHYEIRARATGNPTKDQMRLMMQSLLAERFKLAIHFETRERPVLALTLIKPKTPGLKLRLHADGPACDSHEPPSPNSAANIDVFPPICNEYMAIDKPDHKILTGARNTTVELMAAFFSNIGQLGRPVVDHTGLNGPIDFTMEYTPDSNAASGTSAPPDLKGETFLEAVKEQLGLKLEPTKARLDIPVVDHVERPSEN